jgi:hypothetical protein
VVQPSCNVVPIKKLIMPGIVEPANIGEPVKVGEPVKLGKPIKLGKPMIPPSRLEKLNKIKQMFSDDKIDEIIKKRRDKHKKTIKRTIKKHHLGKKNGSVCVLIKSSKHIKKVNDDIKTLKKNTVFNIKQYLKKHNFIKSGSAAPEDILRNMYEDSILTGDIFNNNTETLLHNYLNKDEPMLA